MSFFEFMSPYLGYFTVFGLLMLGLICRKVSSVFIKKERNEDKMTETQINLQVTVELPESIIEFMIHNGVSRAEAVFLLGIAKNFSLTNEPINKEETGNGKEINY